MAIDASIPLQIRGPDFSQGINIFLQGRQQNQQRERQERVDAENKVLRDLKIDKVRADIEAAGETRKVERYADDLVGYRAGFEAGDLPGVRTELTNRLAEITAQKGGDPDETLRLLKLFDEDPNQFSQFVEGEIQGLTTLGFLKSGRSAGGLNVNAPVTLINPTTKEKKLVSPVTDKSTGLATLSEFDIPEGFELSTETSEEKRIADIIAANTKKIQALEAEQKFKPRTAADIDLAKQSVARAGKQFAQIDKIKTNVLNLKDARRQVLAGAGTGPIDKLLPSFLAASVALDSAVGRLGLDVVQSVTFGALSKGELDLSKDIALPTGLEGEDLIRWIDERIAAQTTVADYLERQAIFLSETDENGDQNTVAGWTKKEKAIMKNILDSQGITDEDIIETIRTNPDMNDRGDVLRELRRRFESGGA